MVHCSRQVDRNDLNTEASPTLPEPPWRRLRRRNIRRALSREVIVDAALALLDREGVDAVSMRGVAEELGTGPASLYWHVADKEELLDFVYDRIIGEVELPPGTGTWQEQLKEFARNIRRVLSQHRDVARITLARIPTGQNAIVRMEKLLAILREAGIPPRVIALGADAMTLYVNAFCYEEAVPFRAVGKTRDVEESAGMLEKYLSSLPPDRFPNFVALAGDLTSGSFDERFELGLEVFIKGLETYASRR